MIKFEKRNVNPKGKKTGDCVIRALTVATGKKYEDIYRELFEISLKTGWILNEKRVEDKLLERYGFVKHKQPRKYDNTKYTIGEIDQITSGLYVDGKEVKTVVIRCAHHLTVVVDNTLVDTWDCRYKCISNYYTKS